MGRRITLKEEMAQAAASRKPSEQLADSIAEPAEEFKTPAKKKKTSKKKTPKKDQ